MSTPPAASVEAAPVAPSVTPASPVAVGPFCDRRGGGVVVLVLRTIRVRESGKRRVDGDPRSGRLGRASLVADLSCVLVERRILRVVVSVKARVGVIRFEPFLLLGQVSPSRLSSVPDPLPLERGCSVRNTRLRHRGLHSRMTLRESLRGSSLVGGSRDRLALLLRLRNRLFLLHTPSLEPAILESPQVVLTDAPTRDAPLVELLVIHVGALASEIRPHTVRRASTLVTIPLGGVVFPDPVDDVVGFLRASRKGTNGTDRGKGGVEKRGVKGRGGWRRRGCVEDIVDVHEKDG
jgi:hypothetical protein